MPDKHLDAIRNVFDHWGRGDFTGGRDLFDPHVVLVLRPEFPDAGAYLGAEGVARYMRGFLDPWTHLTIEATEIIPAGDNVIVAVLQRGLGETSGIETELTYFQVWTFRGTSVIRYECIMDREDALAAVGLRD